MTDATVQLTRGITCRIDQASIPLISGFSWHAHICGGRFYACAKNGRRNGNKTIYMHRLLLGAQEGDEVDHKNGDSLDNRLCNIRLCTRSQNNANIRANSKAKSGYRGVYPKRSKWYGRVIKNKVYYFTPSFFSPAEAAAARDALAIDLFGDFAALSIGAK